MLTHHHTKCLTCGYDLYGSTSPVCPECGTDKFKLPKSRRRVEPLRRLAEVDSRVGSDTMPIAGFLVAAFISSIAAIVWLTSSAHYRFREQDYGDSGFAVQMVAVAAGTFAATLFVWYGTIWTLVVWKAWGRSQRRWRRPREARAFRTKPSRIGSGWSRFIGLDRWILNNGIGELGFVAICIVIVVAIVGIMYLTIRHQAAPATPTTTFVSQPRVETPKWSVPFRRKPSERGGLGWTLAEVEAEWGPPQGFTTSRGGTATCNDTGLNWFADPQQGEIDEFTVTEFLGPEGVGHSAGTRIAAASIMVGKISVWEPEEIQKWLNEQYDERAGKTRGTTKVEAEMQRQGQVVWMSLTRLTGGYLTLCVGVVTAESGKWSRARE